MFDRIVQHTYMDTTIEYGIIDGEIGCNKILFIKAGQNGSCYGYKNKYLKIAERSKEKYGCTVITSSNPFNGGNPLDDVKEVIELQCSERKLCCSEAEIYYMGLSNGAIMGAWYAYRYQNIKRMMLVNMPIDVSHWHYTKFGIEKYLLGGNELEIVYGEYDPSCQYIDLIKDISKDIGIHVILGEDHNFTFRMEDFLSLPEKYLLGRNAI